MSDVNTPVKNVELGLRLEGGDEGRPVVSYKASSDFAAPTTVSERLEWVRQSYERFFAKVMEKETLMPPAPPLEVG